MEIKKPRHSLIPMEEKQKLLQELRKMWKESEEDLCGEEYREGYREALKEMAEIIKES